MIKAGSGEQSAAAALAWIVGILSEHKIPFLVTGGLAARIYGSTRPLADIDLDVPEECLPVLAGFLASHVVFGPARVQDQEWDITLLTLSYAGWSIDLGGAYRTRVFDRAAQSWVAVRTDLETAVRLEVFGLEVPVVAKDDLVAYKRRLNREVDRIDVAAVEASR
jgi:hypothetical protein